MEDLLSVGQWQGFYTYGPEYGKLIEGQEAEFRLFVEACSEGQFSGRAIDWDGIGTNGEVAVINGFIDGDIISFTKQYAEYHTIDEWGNTAVLKDMPGHKVVYEGRFDRVSNTFTGTWEIVFDLKHTTDLTFEEVSTGTWRMHRQA
ncbi:MAG TPA: hypothetical protein VFR58_11465 [Flavisolibacter sp.]|nr:hypothetical protein [Flavisolibacter sp.]